MSKKKKTAILTFAVVILGAAIILLKDRLAFPSDNSPTLFVSKETAHIGGEAYATVSVKNNPGMAGFVLELEYDEQKLSPMDISGGRRFIYNKIQSVK